MARNFSVITVGQIVDELRSEGIPYFARTTFYRLEKRLDFPKPNRTSGQWRSYDREAADEVKKIIKGSYGIVNNLPNKIAKNPDTIPNTDTLKLDLIKLLKELDDLRKKNILTEEEFLEKKRKILREI